MIIYTSIEQIAGWGRRSPFSRRWRKNCRRTDAYGLSPPVRISQMVTPASASITLQWFCHSGGEICWHRPVRSLKLTLQLRHNERHGVSNHRSHDCLLRRRSKKTSKLRVTGLCAGNSPVTGESPHKRPVTGIRFPFDDVIMDHLIGGGFLSTTSIWSSQERNSFQNKCYLLIILTGILLQYSKTCL